MTRHYLSTESKCQQIISAPCKKTLWSPFPDDINKQIEILITYNFFFDLVSFHWYNPQSTHHRMQFICISLSFEHSTLKSVLIWFLFQKILVFFRCLLLIFLLCNIHGKYIHGLWWWRRGNGLNAIEIDHILLHLFSHIYMAARQTINPVACLWWFGYDRVCQWKWRILCHTVSVRNNSLGANANDVSLLVTSLPLNQWIAKIMWYYLFILLFCVAVCFPFWFLFILI